MKARRKVSFLQYECVLPHRHYYSNYSIVCKVIDAFLSKSIFFFVFKDCSNETGQRDNTAVVLPSVGTISGTSPHRKRWYGEMCGWQKTLVYDDRSRLKRYQRIVRTTANSLCVSHARHRQRRHSIIHIFYLFMTSVNNL